MPHDSAAAGALRLSTTSTSTFPLSGHQSPVTGDGGSPSNCRARRRRGRKGRAAPKAARVPHRWEARGRPAGVGRAGGRAPVRWGRGGPLCAREEDRIPSGRRLQRRGAGGSSSFLLFVPGGRERGMGSWRMGAWHGFLLLSPPEHGAVPLQRLRDLLDDDGDDGDEGDEGEGDGPGGGVWGVGFARAPEETRLRRMEDTLHSPRWRTHIRLVWVGVCSMPAARCCPHFGDQPPRAGRRGANGLLQAAPP
eukprot:gene3775-biopygen10852